MPITSIILHLVVVVDEDELDSAIGDGMFEVGDLLLEGRTLISPAETLSPPGRSIESELAGLPRSAKAAFKEGKASTSSSEDRSSQMDGGLGMVR